MRVSINANDPRPIYVQIVDEVRRALVVGALQPDDPLPSTRELAAELRVNPNTVAQAYRELERAQVVYSRRGSGTFVSASADPRGKDRVALLHDVASRARVDAHRNGLTVDELIQALRESGDGAMPTDSSSQTDSKGSSR